MLKARGLKAGRSAADRPVQSAVDPGLHAPQRDHDPDPVRLREAGPCGAMRRRRPRRLKRRIKPFVAKWPAALALRASAFREAATSERFSALS